MRGNDQLTDGVPGAAADSLLEWGLELAQGIGRDTADLADEAAEAGTEGVAPDAAEAGPWVGKPPANGTGLTAGDG